MTTEPLTADAVTDADVRNALSRGWISADLAVNTGAALLGGKWYAPDHVSRPARARVAEIINARRAKETSK